MGQSLGCYLAGISSRFVWLSSFCYYACLVGQSLGCYLVGIISRFPCLNVRRFFSIFVLMLVEVSHWVATWLTVFKSEFSYRLSSLYFVPDAQFHGSDKGCRFVGVTFCIDNFFLLLLLHSFKSVQQFLAFQLSRELCFFLWGFSHSCVACGGFLSPHFLFSRLIGLHISMCCDSVSFDFIKPATTVARFIQHSCLFIF